jgi:hypothetical protein
VFLAATANDRPQHLTRAKDAGFTAVLVKPLDIDSLATDIRRQLPASLPAGSGDVLPRDVRTDGFARRSGGASFRPMSHLTLALLAANLVKTVGTSEGVLALRDERQDELVIVAAHSLRAGATLPSPDTRVPVTSGTSVDQALSRGEPVVAEPGRVEQSPLLPAECTVALVTPVTDQGVTYGVVILGERRKRTFGLPAAQVAQCVAETARIAAVLRQFEQLDEAVQQRRREMDEMRIAAVRAVAAPDVDADRETFVRLVSRLGERLGLPARLRPVLEHAQRVHDVGRVWLGRAVLPLSMLSPDECQGLLDDHAEQTLEILTALDCPSLVVDVVASSRRPWTELEGEIGLAARIVAVVGAYQALTEHDEANRTPLRAEDAVAEISKAAGARFDPAVVEALVDLVTEPDGGDAGPLP